MIAATREKSLMQDIGSPRSSPRFSLGIDGVCRAGQILRVISMGIYRVFHNDGPKVFAYCSKNMITSDILSPLRTQQMWSI